MRKDYGDVKVWQPGARVEIHPGCDLWMRGAKYGTVTDMDGEVVLVRMDHPQVRKVQRFPLDRVRPA